MQKFMVILCLLTFGTSVAMELRSGKIIEAFERLSLRHTKVEPVQKNDQYTKPTIEQLQADTTLLCKLRCTIAISQLSIVWEKYRSTKMAHAQIQVSSDGHGNCPNVFVWMKKEYVEEFVNDPLILEAVQLANSKLPK